MSIEMCRTLSAQLPGLLRRLEILTIYFITPVRIIYITRCWTIRLFIRSDFNQPIADSNYLSTDLVTGPTQLHVIRSLSYESIHHHSSDRQGKSPMKDLMGLQVLNKFLNLYADSDSQVISPLPPADLAPSTAIETRASSDIINSGSKAASTGMLTFVANFPSTLTL